MKRTPHVLRCGVLALAMIGMTGAAAATELEVLHHFTSGSEARSLDLLKQMVARKGVTWKDFAVEGDVGAMSTLSARMKANKSVSVASLQAPQIQYWGRQGALGNLDALAARQNWDAIIPPAITGTMKYQGHYVAAPLNVHRENWLYVNVPLFNKVGAKIPDNFDELFAAADRFKAAGIVPFAWGGQAWQDRIVLESVVLGVGGPGFYRKIFADRDPAALTSPTMTKAWEVMARIRTYLDKYNVDREWSLATSMVIHGKGAMQFMGDWAKGEFFAKGKVPGKDFTCVPAPGTRGAFIFTIDTFAVFANKEPRQAQAQEILADTVLSPEFQEAFNLNKGSIPARLGIPRDKFDTYALASMDDLADASKHGALVPSMAMAASPDQAEAFHEVSAKFMTSTMSPAEATDALARALKGR